MPEEKDLSVALARLDQKVIDLSEKVDRGFSDIKDSILVRVESLEKTKAERDDVEKVQCMVNEIQKHLNEKVERRMADLEMAAFFYEYINSG